MKFLVEIIHLNFRLPPLTMDWRMVEAPKTIKVVDERHVTSSPRTKKVGSPWEAEKRGGSGHILSIVLFVLLLPWYYASAFVATEIRLGAALRRANPLRRTLPRSSIPP